jgi:DNA polymerase-3 subunit delta
LLFTAAAVDARKRVVKRLRELDAFVALEVARERSGALGREVVDSVVARVTAEFEKRLTPAARELVTRRAGSDLAMLVLELEKLCLYVGDAPAIDVDDVRCAFRDMAESWVFDFTTALATRELRRALVLLRGLLVQGEPPLRLLAMMSREVRLLLLARECLDTTLQGQWRAGAPYQAFQTRVLPLVDDDTRMAFGGAHPFALYRRFQDASKVSSAALRDALVQLSDLDVRLKSTRTDPALLLEAFVIGWCGA